MSGDDSAWVFDSLVGFLQGPIWNAPILTFIEQKSQIFEPNDSAENEEQYKQVHNEYKDLVDTMLGSYMEDMGITPEQFAKACSKSSTEGTEIKFHETLFEQVWAANDFDIFRRMMIQKNVELQLQALDMIQQRYGITPASFLPGEDGENQQSDEDARILDEVIKKSLEEYEACKLQLDFSSMQMEESLNASREEHSRFEAETKREREMLQAVIQQSKESHLPTTKTVLPQAETDVKIKTTKVKAIVTQPPTVVDDAELAKRQQYLKSQRDKLLAMKKQEREKQLLLSDEGASKVRPRSARAAQTALTDTTTRAPDSNDTTLQVRQALVDRLKAEVMGRM